ncbi:MAG: glycine cleavage T C-terminal barrel domain-containing protein [Litorilinea sp.]
MTNNDLNLSNYTALGQAAWLDRTHYGQLRLSGADRVDFLQRMTTNHIARLQPGQAAVTVLTSPTARIMFVFTVLCRADDLILLPAGPHQLDALAKHLRGQIFFMDKVTVHEMPEYTRIRVVGAQAAQRLATVHAPVAELPDGAFIEHSAGILLNQQALDLPGYEALVTGLSISSLRYELQIIGIPDISDAAAYTARRVELGRPAAPTELNDGYNPLEAGLAWTCAENKGCYTGQEIIARQITYDKVTRTLVGVQSPTPLTPGAKITIDGKQAGTVTTAAYSPALQSHLALAVVRRPHNVAGQAVEVASEIAAAAETASSENGNTTNGDAPNGVAGSADAPPAIAARIIDLPLVTDAAPTSSVSVSASVDEVGQA